MDVRLTSISIPTHIHERRKNGNDYRDSAFPDTGWFSDRKGDRDHVEINRLNETKPCDEQGLVFFVASFS